MTNSPANPLFTHEHAYQAEDFATSPFVVFYEVTHWHASTAAPRRSRTGTPSS